MNNLKSKTNLELAHIVKTDGDVGATFHLEPNHNPRSGEPAQVWFALTTSGGTLIPLEDCNCQLQVFKQGDRSEAIAIPPLTAISAEGYEDIPGADLVFPEAGIYELVLGGSPQEARNFADFTLTYDVTVRPGTAMSPTLSETESEIENTTVEPNFNLGIGVWEVLIVGIVIIFAGGWWWMRSRNV